MSRQENIQSEITNEFANLFTSLSSRIRVFQTTQRDFVLSLHPKISASLPDLNDEDLDTAIAIYGICITDDAFQNYDIDKFGEDIAYLKGLIKEDDQGIPINEKIDEVSQQQTVSLSENNENRSVWTEMAEDAIANETAFMKLLTGYYQINSHIAKAVIKLNNDIILHHINERQEMVITSLLIRTHFLPLFEKITKIYESVPIIFDLRFASAQIIMAIERLIHPKKPLDSQAATYHKIKEYYPLGDPNVDGDCDDLHWDLSEQVLFNKYYPLLREMLQPQIEIGLTNKREARLALLNSLEQVKIQPQQGSTESIRSSIDSLIFEIFQFNRTFQQEQRAKMQKAIESVLKRMALEEYGVQDIPNVERYTEYFDEELFYPIFNEYPQMFFPFIDIRYYSHFMNEPLEYIETHKDYIMNQFWFNMRKYGAINNPGPSQLAHAFSMILFDILNNKKVRGLDV